MTVRRFLDASTAHVSEATRRRIDDGEIGAPVYPHPNGYGWFLYVLDESNDDDTIPADLSEVFDCARQNACDYVLLDRDGPVIANLARYDQADA